MNRNMLAGGAQTQWWGFQSSGQRSVKHCHLSQRLHLFFWGGTLRLLAWKQLILWAAPLPQVRTGILLGGGLGSQLLTTTAGHNCQHCPKKWACRLAWRELFQPLRVAGSKPIGWFNQKHCLALSCVLLYVGTHAARRQRGHTFIFKRRTLEPLGKNILDWEPKHSMMLNKPANWKISIGPCNREAGEGPIRWKKFFPQIFLKWYLCAFAILLLSESKSQAVFIWEHMWCH